LIIREAHDARYLWFALRNWLGTSPEIYFGELGVWAEKKLKHFIGTGSGVDGTISPSDSP
jgi:hypothetical protein